MVRLHGTLVVRLTGARSLPNLDLISRKIKPVPIFSKLLSIGEHATGLDHVGTDPYACVDLGLVRVARTQVAKDTLSPVWDVEFHILSAYHVDTVDLVVRENQAVGSATVGTARILAGDLLPGAPLDGWFTLRGDGGSGEPVVGEDKKHAAIQAWLQFIPAGVDPEFLGEAGRDLHVARTYFPLRRGCRVTLFQDAHVPDNHLPNIYLNDGSTYHHGRAWEQLYHAILEAQHLIYLVGWSVYADIPLVRDPNRPDGIGPTFGSLLKEKAAEGVRVLLLVWDDKTSVNSPLLKRDGIMATHDEDTNKLFSGSKVRCVLCPRNPSSEESLLLGMETGTFFSHHQKHIIVDAPVRPEEREGGPQSRRLVAFVGGIDVCNGRYDTQEHPLFRTLGPEGPHRGDFHQPCLVGATVDQGGPREPWHDIHSKVEGPIAWDVLWNFEQRWRRQAPELLQGELLNPQRLIELLQPVVEFRGAGDPVAYVTDDRDPATWHVQLFRSIDTGSASMFPTNPADISAQGLVCAKRRTFERSIQDAYIHAIRRAQNFIYIENQYFLGSSFAWESHQTCGCFQTIPIEIALKICDKIRRGQRFAAYIVVPMYPEGVPDSGSVQTILCFQNETMKMMYRLIARTLEEVGRGNEHPRDFLSFFCLGNREPPHPNEFPSITEPPAGTPYAQAQISRRFMIYVHSKMMIVDDEFIILGSANINQRSMDGSRDTEVAVGCSQPCHQRGGGGAGTLPRGQVHGFRMSLWAEHTGVLLDSYLAPESLLCVRDIARMAWFNWQSFAAPEVVKLNGHLMTYPVEVKHNGDVLPLAGQRHFPDTKALVLGGISNLPDMLTT